MEHITKPLRSAACGLALCAALLPPASVAAQSPGPYPAGGEAPALAHAINVTPNVTDIPHTAVATSGATANTGGAVWLEVEQILQQPELPNGCEVTSLAMLLAYHGHSVPKTELAERYLTTQSRHNDGNMEWGGDPEEVYPGNPGDNTGWYCYAKPLATAANRYLTAVGANYTAQDISGVSVEALEEYLRAGTPVAVWITTDGLAPRFSETAAWRLESGRWLRPYVNAHCVVLTGYTGGSFFFADPLDNFAGMGREEFERLYTQMGSRALVLATNE